MTPAPLSQQIFEGIGFLGLFLIILQAIFSFFVGHDGDTHADAAVDSHGGHGGYASYLSIKSIAGILLGFGFGGALIEMAGYGSGLAALGGLVAGLIISSLFIVLMNSLHKLKSDGTAVLAEAVNQTGTVYLPIPAENAGAGEIQVSYGGRMNNVRAFTPGPALASGASVRVLSLHGEQSVVVEKI